MPDGPKPGSEEWNERHYGDMTYDPNLREKLSPRMGGWLDRLIKDRAPPPPDTPEPAPS